MAVSKRPVILIVGGGYSGAAVAFHLAKRAEVDAEIFVVEPRERLGGGLAYSSPDPSHRVNVPARRMSLATGDPDAFARWLDDTKAADGDPDALALGGEVFPRRVLFGRFVADQLAPDLATGRIRHVRARALAAGREGGPFRIRLDDGRVLSGDVLVLAATHPPPRVPGALMPLLGHPGFHADPYDVAALSRIGGADRVLIVGTGLTMADTVASLDRRGHRGPILALSRHGWRSRGHATEAVEPAGDFASDPARSVSALFPRVRAEVRRAADAGVPWQGVFDALRQQGPVIWNALSQDERRRLIRHARTLWDVHRFRIAPQVEAVLDRKAADGTLEVLAASLRTSRAEDGAMAVTLKRRHRDETERRRFDAVVVTTGPGHGDATRTDPFLASLVAEGHLQPDALGLGLWTARDSRAIGTDGLPQEALFVAGPLGRATFGELMGLPEVTASAERVADEVARFVESRSPGASLEAEALGFAAQA